MSTAVPAPTVHVVADYAAALPALRAVRERVFVDEQRVPRAVELDALDPACVHVLAYDGAGAAIGTARLVPPAAEDAPARVSRMAVLPDWRGRGVGAALLDALVDLARGRGWRRLVLDAQLGAEPFYARHGFQPHGPRFEVVGIAHQAMHRDLAGPLAIAEREAAVHATTRLVAAARRRLWIHSRDLDPGLFDQRPVLEALRAFATGGRGNEARLLLHDAAAAQRAHAPLLALAQRMPSVFLFREVADPVDRAIASAFVANDGGGWYFRPLGHRFEGEAEDHGGGRARQLAEAFRPVWERARPCTEFRALGL